MRKSVFSSVADNSASAGPGLHRGNWTEEQQRVLDKTKVFVDDVKRSLVVQASQHHDEHQGPADYGNFPNPRITKQLSNKQRLLETYLSLDLEATLRFVSFLMLIRRDVEKLMTLFLTSSVCRGHNKRN